MRGQLASGSGAIVFQSCGHSLSRQACCDWRGISTEEKTKRQADGRTQAERSAARIVFRETFITQAICLLDRPSALPSRRISAQSSTLITSFPWLD
jgi:hypothetical protein